MSTHSPLRPEAVRRDVLRSRSGSPAGGRPGFTAPRVLLAGAFTFAALCALCAPPVHATYPVSEILNFLSYDPSVPLDPIVTYESGDDFHTTYHLSFTSVNGETVTALLSIPTDPWWSWWGSPPWPCIAYLHGYGGDKSLDDLLLSIMTSVGGYAVLSLDAQYAGERTKPERDIYSLNALQDRNAIAQTVIDYRRALDYLATRPDIDMTRVGFLGGSMGGILGGVIISVEPRFKTAVLIVAGGNWGMITDGSDLSEATPLRESMNGHYEFEAKVMDPIDPINVIHLFAPRPLLMQEAEFDTTVPAETGRLLFEAAGQPKEIDWYPTDHYGIGLPPYVFQISARMLQWFADHL